MQLDQCFQLRLFEQDCEKMLEWIVNHRTAFLATYVEIGRSCAAAKRLQEEHARFAAACTGGGRPSVARVTTAARRLADKRHYAEAQITALAHRLERAYKQLSAGLEERSAVLSLSVLATGQGGAPCGDPRALEQHAQRHRQLYEHMCQAYTEGGAPCGDPRALEQHAQRHRQLYEHMCQAYTEVHSTSKKLLYQLDHLVQVCHQTDPADMSDGTVSSAGSSGGDPAADYSSGANHVLAVIHQILGHHRALEARYHQILGHHRALEARYHQARLKLHQRLALLLYKEDCRQVLDWLANHGEVFLQKNTGIGRNLAKARVYQKSHEHFENVAQNTYTNAEKLLGAAEELARSGECDPEEVLGVARELEAHVAAFAARVDRRRRRLDLAVLLYTHEKELVQWLDTLRSGGGINVADETPEGARRALEQCAQHRAASLDACAATIAQGDALLQDLRSVTAVHTVRAAPRGQPRRMRGHHRARRRAAAGPQQCAQHRAASLDACAATIAQGDALLQDLRSVTVVHTVRAAPRGQPRRMRGHHRARRRAAAGPQQCAQHRAASLDACAATIAQGDALLQDLRSVTVVHTVRAAPRGQPRRMRGHHRARRRAAAGPQVRNFAAICVTLPIAHCCRGWENKALLDGEDFNYTSQFDKDIAGKPPDFPLER
ncbi:spectrin repeat domain-containing protein [Phthorimaea operculella]|nr:spectrin repeat domain-containing protein [Phthorimaea operculella]